MKTHFVVTPIGDTLAFTSGPASQIGVMPSGYNGQTVERVMLTVEVGKEVFFRPLQNFLSPWPDASLILLTSKQPPFIVNMKSNTFHQFKEKTPGAKFYVTPIAN